MSDSEPTLFWPPPPEALREYRRRQVLMIVTLFAPIALLVMAPVGIGVWSDYRGDLTGYMQAMGFVSLGALAGGALLTAITLWAVGRHWRTAMPRGVELASKGLEPDETLRMLCPAMFLGPKVYRGGFLAVTSQRTLEVLPSFKGVTHRTLATPETLESVALTTRQATRVPLWGFALRIMECDQGLTLEAEGKTHFFVCEGVFLRQLVAWLEAEGLEVGVRNDADLAERVALSHDDEGAWVPDAKQRRRGVLTVGLPLALALVFLTVGVVFAIRASSQRTALLTGGGLVTGIGIVGTATTLGQTGSLPAGTRQGLGSVMVGVRAGKNVNLFVYEVFRIDGVPYLRSPTDTRWEALGPAELSDDEALERAQARLKTP